ncbi:aminoacyl-histidine dipeptidase [Aequorivita sublithincola DSM 14238]|uniref:Cytosol non-specific dipeptidase n=1 Tax=Aequorivita sublithincola (strain DSM 14238 / LMG 21431 / ACAM 643 / 9-3) TaxID=746697 RepID=I3YY80_AEQSU|nr:aminoacyl-histidine dipeptidase [Aequorivita sublithincola]AFL81948.1 aminoacyl-histidine dipeptidase [Aequorivita sublithincola DSM 14238]
MNEEIRNLEPKALWNKFADLNAVPRPSKKEERVIAFMKDFGKGLGLETMEDEVGNVIIRKTATKGLEDRKAVVLQSHLDMVHQKNNDTDFNFDTQGIEMVVDGDWVRAKGTTLGADNGLGVATIMAILESNEIEHPAIEALFTIDEETGMTGAKGLKGGLLKGDILLNLDTEEDDEIGVGCAGGVDITAKGTYSETEAPKNSKTFTIKVKGLNGGHSGMDIIKGLGNANKLMNRLLYATKDSMQLAKLEGGSLRNAIPRESVAQVVVSYEEKFQTEFEKMKSVILAEYKSLEPNLSISAEKSEESFSKVMANSDQIIFLNTMNAAHNGVYRMSPDIEDLVETSNNISKVTVDKGNIKIENLTRSSVESSKEALANALSSAYELAGYEVKLAGDYPGWAPNMDSAILKVLDNLYQKMNGEKANVAACHAGLECGILGQNYPEMDMISFGPTIKGAHSPDERASISSAQKYWEFVLEILKNIPKK